jgi:hypothetical protein
MRRSLLTAFAVSFFNLSAQGTDLISIDRPSFCNSTFIVAPGSLQAESGVSRQKSQDRSGTKTWLTQTPVLVRAGVGPRFEGRLNWNGYQWIQENNDRLEGAGDLSAGFKWRHRDAAGRWPAAASVLSLTFPSGAPSVRTLGFRPGWQLPLDWALPGNSGLTLMPAVTYDTSDEGRRFWSGAFGALLSHSWTARIQTFVEYAGQQFAEAKDGGIVETADLGTSWAFLPDWAVDGAVYLGLNHNSPVQYYTLGISTRRLGLWK